MDLFEGMTPSVIGDFLQTVRRSVVPEDAFEGGMEHGPYTITNRETVSVLVVQKDAMCTSLHMNVIWRTSSGRMSSVKR